MVPPGRLVCTSWRPRRAIVIWNCAHPTSKPGANDARDAHERGPEMPAFAGFPPGKNPYTPLPETFFTAILPEIEDVGELKVTLHLFWLLYQKRGTPRCASDRE